MVRVMQSDMGMDRGGVWCHVRGVCPGTTPIPKCHILWSKLRISIGKYWLILLIYYDCDIYMYVTYTHISFNT